MKTIVCVWKTVGLTPLQEVQIFKVKNSEYSNEKISYAGRLDPMAEGVLILLIGDENKNRNKYLNLEKTYESEIVLGISTDSFDALGIVQQINFAKISKEEIEKCLSGFLGKQKQIYPPYSSKAVKGKSLYWWARNNRLEEIEIPTRKVEIYSLKLIEFDEISVNKLTSNLLKDIKEIKGDFRQEEIIKGWEEFGEKYKNKRFLKIKIQVECSTGTYVRRIASDLGEKLGAGAFALSIKRTVVGKFSEKECLYLDFLQV